MSSNNWLSAGKTAVLTAFCTGVVVAQPPVTKVVVANAKLIEAPSTITLVGTVDARRRSLVASEIAGVVIDMPARQGDSVQRGSVLAKLSTDALRLRLVEATARAKARGARHEELLAGTRAETMTELLAELDESVANLERWRFEMERVEQLYEGRDSNKKEFHETRADLSSAKRQHIAAQANYDLGKAGPRKEEIARAAYEFAQEQAVVKRLETDLRKATIRAPFDGFVVSRKVELGEWVPEGGTVLELAEMATVLVKVDVPESAFPYLAIGQPVRVKIDAIKRTLQGKIKHIVPQAAPSARTFPVEIELDNADRQMASGMFARATVAAGPTGQVVAVPKDAVVHRDGVDYLALAVPGHGGGMTGILLGVTVGADIDDWIAISSGNVKAGTAVITRGNEHILPFPTPVIVVDKEGVPVARSPHGGDSPTHGDS